VAAQVNVIAMLAWPMKVLRAFALTPAAITSDAQPQAEAIPRVAGGAGDAGDAGDAAMSRDMESVAQSARFVEQALRPASASQSLPIGAGCIGGAPANAPGHGRERRRPDGFFSRRWRSA
jgi:hypothetical protein